MKRALELISSPRIPQRQTCSLTLNLQDVAAKVSETLVSRTAGYFPKIARSSESGTGNSPAQRLHHLSTAASHVFDFDSLPGRQTRVLRSRRRADSGRRGTTLPSSPPTHLPPLA